MKHARELKQQMAERNWKSWLRAEQQAKTIQELLTLVDGAMEVVALFGANGSPSQKEWAKEWTEKAAKLGAGFD